MKNITLSVDDEVLTAVRRHAAERNCTVNALVREYLTGVARQMDSANGARLRMRQLSEQSKGDLGGRMNRAELYDR